MKSFLFICSSIDSPNGICVRAVIDELAKSKVKVDCICSGQNIPANSSNVKYYTTKGHWFENMQKDKGTLTTKQYQLKLLLGRIKAVLLAPVWPFDAPVYYRSIVNEATKLVKCTQYDAVIGVYNQFECLKAAYYVKQLSPSTKFVPYFLDSLSGGVTPRFLTKKVAYRLSVRAEKFVLSEADSIVIMKSHKEHCNNEWKNEKWLDKMRVLDIPLFVPFPKGETNQEIFDADKVNLVYTGALQENLKNPQYFLQLLSKQDFSDVKVIFVGPSNCDVMLSTAQKATNAVIMQNPSVSHNEVIGLIQSADVLLNIGSMNTRQIPCKIFEYMAAGKPIVSLAPTHDEPSIQYLRQYPKALILYEDEDIADNANLLKQFLANEKYASIDISKLEKVLYICTPKAFVDNLENITDRKRKLNE